MARRRYFQRPVFHQTILVVVSTLACSCFEARGQESPVHYRLASGVELPRAFEQDEQDDEPPEIPETVVEAEPQSVSNPFPSPGGPPNTNAAMNQALLGRAQDLIGETPSASQGRFSQSQIQNLPINRAGDILELIPGMIATQHSGTGKANQYFVRGINLDHGTDFALRFDGVPINLPSHGHGQGYLDVNWIIPELIEFADYKLGPYYADIGDFSSAGSVDVHTRSYLPYGITSVTAGQFDYYRVLVANSQEINGGHFLYAYESVFYDGPWHLPEDFNKFNGFMKWTLGDEIEGLSLSAMAYRSYWNATNQIPVRAVANGLVDRFGSLDPSDAGDTGRVGLNLQYWKEDSWTSTHANAYVNYYDLDLFSNFTFFLDDPINGDQIEQVDQRLYSGLNVSRTYHTEFVDHTLGFQFRNDNINHLKLNKTSQRQFVSSVRDDQVDQQSYSMYYINEAQLTGWMRSYAGFRGDFYRFQNRSMLNPADSGAVSDEVFSPKAGLVFGPWADSELFVNWGQSFHSNDTRGVTSAMAPADPLVKSEGSEVGVRSFLTPTWNSTLTAWYLEIDSELLFVGDAGTTEPGPPSHRAGITWTNYWQVSDTMTLDADYAYVRPRFIDEQRIPNAVEHVLSGGVTLQRPNSPWYSTIRLRHYGPAALLEDNSQRSSTTTLVNLRAGFQTPRLDVAVDIFNLLDRDDNDITYFYESQPMGLPAAEDLHFHTVEPLMARASVTLKY